MGYFDNKNLSAKRGHNESFKDYKERMKKNNNSVKMHLKGELFWDSRNQGTYVRKTQN